jgi:tRNA(adenine34) deaminase
MNNDNQNARDMYWMRRAIALATRGRDLEDEIPVGAILVCGDQKLGQGWNRNITLHDPSAHAEIIALRQAGRKRRNHRIIDTTLYVTLEPCAMCAMAMIHARITRVVYAASDFKTGAAGSVFNILGSDKHNHRIDVSAGVLAEEASALLTHYFKTKRAINRTSRT